MITLAFGVPKMGKTQSLMDYVGAQARSQRFFVVCRAGDWQSESLDEHGLDRWRGQKFRQWGDTQSKLASVIPGVDRLFESSLPWYGEAPPPPPIGEETVGVLDGEMDDWLSSLPLTGVFRFGYPWEGIDVARMCWQLGNVTYVDDEIDEVAVLSLRDSNDKPISWQRNPLRLFCHRGRHLPNRDGEVCRVHVLGAARRAQSLHVDLSNLADQCFVFRVQGARTLERLMDDRVLRPDELDRATSQPPYEFKVWQSSGESSWRKLAPL